MTTILLRDDDPNATTNPERLASAYAPLLDAGFPINFSVIPNVALDTRAPDGARERFLDEDSPDSPEERPLTAATPIVRWLRSNEGVSDVFVHGFSHRRIAGGTEFGALDVDVARDRLERASTTFLQALGHVPAGFVAPWDALSRGSLQAAGERFALISTGWVDRSKSPASAWPSHFFERLTRREVLPLGGSWVLRHRGGKLAPETRAEDVSSIVGSLCQGAEVAVIVLHHWMFWGSDPARPTAHPVIRALARALTGHRVVTLREATGQLQSRSGWSPLPAAAGIL